MIFGLILLQRKMNQLGNNLIMSTPKNVVASPIIKKEKKRAHTSGIRSPAKKKLRSQAPDVVVSVGTGSKNQEFECYKIILSYASDYFDSLLSDISPDAASTIFSGQRGEPPVSRIAFPNKDPEEWKLFYEFVDPTTHKEAKVTIDNALVLAPWFREFKMNDQLDECDAIISTENFFIKYIQVHRLKIIRASNPYKPITIWKQQQGNGHDAASDRSVETIEKVLKFHSFCEKNVLKMSHVRAAKEVGTIMSHAQDLLAEKIDLMQKIMDIFLKYYSEMKSQKYVDADAFKFYSELSGIQTPRDWNSDIYKKWVKSQLELVVMKKLNTKMEKDNNALKHTFNDLPHQFYMKFNPNLNGPLSQSSSGDRVEQVKKQAKNLLVTLIKKQNT